MNREDMLAGLIAQAALDGGDLVTLRAIVEEASEVGAGRAPRAEQLAQFVEIVLRRFVRQAEAGAWRAAKASAWKAAIEWVVRGVFALLLIGIAVRLGLPGMLK